MDVAIATVLSKQDNILIKARTTIGTKSSSLLLRARAYGALHFTSKVRLSKFPTDYIIRKKIKKLEVIKKLYRQYCATCTHVDKTVGALPLKTDKPTTVTEIT